MGNKLFSVEQDGNKDVQIVWPNGNFTPVSVMAAVEPIGVAGAAVVDVAATEPAPAPLETDGDATAVIGADDEAEIERAKNGPRKKGYGSGINAYPGCELQGCLNDTVRHTKIAHTKYGFLAQNIRLLMDTRADTKGMLDRLKWLVSDNKPGDILFYYYSGHGAMVQDRSPIGRVRGVTTCICPVDFDWSPERMITDVQFVQIFSQLPRGVKLFWISDSCHSGALNREMRFGNPRYCKPRQYPVPFDVHWGIEAAKQAGFGDSKVIRDFIRSADFDVAFVPGCTTTQTSADTVDAHGNPCGALSDHFSNVIEPAPMTMTVKDATDKTRFDLARDQYDQTPIADGPLITGPWLQ